MERGPQWLDPLAIVGALAVTEVHNDQRSVAANRMTVDPVRQ
jgi:hypothetical protein